MKAKLRVNCPHCGTTADLHCENATCVKCCELLEYPKEASLYIYRLGSMYLHPCKFRVYINDEMFGFIGNRELIRVPLKYGTYNIRSTLGVDNDCYGMQVTLTEENPAAYVRVRIKSGMKARLFVEPMDPKLLGL